jgi:hypothetical protein
MSDNTRERADADERFETLQAQCWICPTCYNDHARDSECLTEDLKWQLDRIKNELTAARATIERQRTVIKGLTVSLEDAHDFALCAHRRESAKDAIAVVLHTGDTLRGMKEILSEGQE